MATKTHSGGGKTPTKQTTRTGAAAQGVDPGAVSRIGAKQYQPVPAERTPMPAGGGVKLGNEVALNVGRGGAGTGRTVHARGTQGTHGPVNQGDSPPSRGILTVGKRS